MSKIVIRQFKSAIGQKESARQTLEALGLRRPGNVVVREDSATVRGQIRKIAHLVRVHDDRRTSEVEVENERRAASQPAPAEARKPAAKGWQRRTKVTEAEASGSAS
jgi:large subunit ribosomal protein L30